MLIESLRMMGRVDRGIEPNLGRLRPSSILEWRTNKPRMIDELIDRVPSIERSRGSRSSSEGTDA